MDLGRIQLQDRFLISYSNFQGTLLSVILSSVQNLRFPESLVLSLSMQSVRCWSVIFAYQPFLRETRNLGFEL